MALAAGVTAGIDFRWSSHSKECHRCVTWFSPPRLCPPRRLSGPVSPRIRPCSNPLSIDSSADLELLHKTNPDHYERAKRLLAASRNLCKPGEPKLQNADGRDISCDFLLLTSLPPKRRLSFTLDNTRYSAIVTITGPSALMPPARLTPAAPSKSGH